MASPAKRRRKKMNGGYGNLTPPPVVESEVAPEVPQAPKPKPKKKKGFFGK